MIDPVNKNFCFDQVTDARMHSISACVHWKYKTAMQLPDWMPFSQKFPQILGTYNIDYDAQQKRVSIFGNLILSGSLLSDSYKWQLSARFTLERRYVY